MLLKHACDLKCIIYIGYQGFIKNGECPKTFEWEYTYFDNYIKEVS